MIENLKGLHEAVDFIQESPVRIFHNQEDENYPPHWHTPFELILPIDGDYQAKLNNKLITIKQDEILLICPGCIHELCAPVKGCRLIIQFYVEPSSSLKELTSIMNLIYPAILITPEQFPQFQPKVHSLVMQIEQLYRSPPPFAAMSLYTKVLELLTVVGQEYFLYQNHTQLSSGQKDKLEKFIFIYNYITEHCTEDLPLEKVAALAGFSKYHFTRLFKQFANVSYYTYLSQKRISYVQQLLADPSVMITEAALRAGFSTMSSFARMFKKINHCTATEYREMYHGGTQLGNQDKKK